MTQSDMLRMAEELLIGFGEFCGMEIQSIDGKTLSGTMPLSKEFLNVHGFAHGGAINTLMDTAAGILATFATDPPRHVVTRSADNHFLRPIGGDSMRVEAQVVKTGKTCCLVNTDVYDDQGRIAAVGYFDVVYVTVPQDRLIEEVRRAEFKKESWEERP